MQKNKINIIFLDVDGVLNSRAYLNNHKDPEDEIDMRAVEGCTGTCCSTGSLPDGKTRT